MDEAKLQEIEAQANEVVRRCSDCDAPARWSRLLRVDRVWACDAPARWSRLLRVDLVWACDAPARWSRLLRVDRVWACDACVSKRPDWEPVRSSALDALDLAAEVRRITAALATARREGAEAMLARCRTAARAAFDAHPLTLDRYHSPGCICDAIGRGSCSECDRGDAVVDALDALPLDGDGGGRGCAAPGRRILALATALGVRNPRIEVVPTTGPGARSWRKGVEVRLLSDSWAPDSADGPSEDEAGGVMLRMLVTRAQHARDTARALAAVATEEAAQLDAALTAALAGESDGGAT